MRYLWSNVRAAFERDNICIVGDIKCEDASLASLPFWIRGAIQRRKAVHFVFTPPTSNDIAYLNDNFRTHLILDVTL